MRRLALDDDGPGRCMIARRRFARELKLVGQEADSVVVLGMNHDESARLASNAHNFQDFPVSKGKAFIGHEDFERGIAIRYETRQFLSKHLLSRVRNNQVEGGVDMTVTFSKRVVILQRLAERLPFLLQAERQDCRIAPERGRSRCALESVRNDDTGCRGLRNMNLAVDSARQNQSVGCVKPFVRSSEAMSQGGNAPIAD